MLSEDESKKILEEQVHPVRRKKRFYERMGQDSRYSEELEFHQYRKKKFEELDKKAKHLLIFSNINSLQFTDINRSDEAKAWAVLYHFKNKSFHSILYDKFESLSMRNATSKSKNHELFLKFYLQLGEKVTMKGKHRIYLANKCENTGWPIDIYLQSYDE